MATLNQVVATENRQKAQTEDVVTKLYHLLQKPPLFEGRTRVYRPRDDSPDAETLPPEGERVQATVEDVLADFRQAQGALLDLTAQKVYANAVARGDVEVDGVVVLKAVPVEYLLYLEKRLHDMRTAFSAIPTLDPSAAWPARNTDGFWATAKTTTHRTKKVPRTLVKAVSTDKHPAQVDVWYEDETVGYWDTTRFSGAMQGKDRQALLMRLHRLEQAVQRARSQAATIEAAPQPIAATVFDFLFSAQ